MDKGKTRRGPAPLGADERRTHCVSVRLNAEELAWLDGARGAHQRGEWMRVAAMGRRLPVGIPEVNREAWAALARTVGNINQLAHAANAGQPVVVDSHLLAEVRDQVQALRRQLLGVTDEGES